MSNQEDIKTPTLKIVNNIPEIQEYLSVLISNARLYHNAEPILIGSRALQIHVPERKYELSKVKDHDLIVSAKWLSLYISHIVSAVKSIQLTVHPAKTHVQLRMFDDEKGAYGMIPEYNFDFEILIEGSSSEIIYKIMRQETYRYPFVYVRKQSIKQQQTYGMKTSMLIAPLEVLEAIKTSHIYWSHKFDQNIEDLHIMRDIIFEYPTKKRARQVGKLRKPSCTALMLRRREEKEQISEHIPASHIHMNQSSDEFLEKNQNSLMVEKMIPHDDLHKLVAIHPEIGPLYKKILVTPEKAKCDENKWDLLTQDERLDDIREEAMVLAVERFLLPKLINTFHYQSAYQQALAKICTTVAKNWFREFAIDHYPLLKNCPKDIGQITKEIYQKYLDRLKETKENNSDIFSNESLEIANERYKMWTGSLKDMRKDDKYDLDAEYYRYQACGDVTIIEDVIICNDMRHAYVFSLYHKSDRADCSASEEWGGRIVLTYLRDEYYKPDNTINTLLKFFMISDQWEVDKYYQKIQTFKIEATDVSGGSWGDPQFHSIDLSLYFPRRERRSISTGSERENVYVTHKPWILDNIWMRMLCEKMKPKLKYGGNEMIDEQLQKIETVRIIEQAYQFEQDEMKDERLVYELQHPWVSLYVMVQSQAVSGGETYYFRRSYSSRTNMEKISPNKDTEDED